MTWLWITMIITGLLAILLEIHIKAVMQFSIGGIDNCIYIKCMFLKFKLLPKEAERAVEDAAEDEAGENNKKRDKKQLLPLLKAAYEDIKKGVFSLLGYIISHAVTIYELNISADFGFQNPMLTGMVTGIANAAVYNIIGVLDRHMQLKTWDVNLQPDFEEEKLKAGIYCVLGTNVRHILVLGGIIIKMAVKILFISWRMKKNEQSGK